MEKFLKMHKLSKPNQEEIENLSRPITSKRIISVMKNLPKRTKKKPGPDGFTGECYRTFKELILIFLRLFQKVEEEEILPNEASLSLILTPDEGTTRKNYRPISHIYK